MVNNEIQCTTCIKKDVCKYVNSLQQTYEDINDIEIKDMFQVKVLCNSYKFNGLNLNR